MKFFILFIILFGCTNSTLKPSGEFKKNMPNYLSSDTFDITCYKTLNNLKLQNLIFLEACYIKYSQKKSDEIAKLYGSGELPLEFNFDTGKKNLYFALKGDTISIRILYMYNYEGFINEPLSAIETKGVVVSE